MFKNRNKSAFTLIELLVVIAIIGILSTLAVVSLTNARQSARDAKRIADIKQIQTSLELYYNDNGQYPATITDSIATSGIVYMQTYPTAPTPADGDCTDENNAYTYEVSGTENSSYSLSFCLGNKTNDLDAGVKEAIPGGIILSSFLPSAWACGDNIIDSRDSKSYATVLIGGQCWMKENLAYLPVVHSYSQFATQGSSSLPGYSVTGYDGSDVPTAKATSNFTTYGVLYNGYAIGQTGINAICPTGWHVPSEVEWTTLATSLGGDSVAGGKMKETGTTHWNSPNDGATNESTLTVLPAGSITYEGSIYGFRILSMFWTSSNWNPGYYWYISLSTYDGGFGKQVYLKTEGFSVRCLLD
jgi:uncharacterized protein (TIGR02145 family)/prepilin-type N-terminal cleavage/methylation domain-containing protein